MSKIFLNLWNNVYTVLKEETIELGLFTSFKMVFLAVQYDLSHATRLPHAYNTNRVV